MAAVKLTVRERREIRTLIESRLRRNGTLSAKELYDELQPPVGYSTFYTSYYMRVKGELSAPAPAALVEVVPIVPVEPAPEKFAAAIHQNGVLFLAVEKGPDCFEITARLEGVSRTVYRSLLGQISSIANP